MGEPTPGPWFAINDGTDAEPMMSVKAARIAGQTPRHTVAICATGDSPQPMENANARLIAAAPDLRDALFRLQWAVAFRPAHQPVVESGVCLCIGCAAAGAREALNKAEDRS